MPAVTLWLQTHSLSSFHNRQNMMFVPSNGNKDASRKMHHQTGAEGIHVGLPALLHVAALSIKPHTAYKNKPPYITGYPKNDFNKLS